MDTPRPTNPSNNLPPGEPTITRRKMRNSGLRVFNPGNNSDEDAVLIPRNVTPQTTTQLLPKPLPVPGVAQRSYFPQQIPLQQLQSPHTARPAQRQSSHPTHSASSSTSSISIPGLLSSQPVFQFLNGARQAGAQSSPTYRYANASPLNYVGSSSSPRSSPAMDATTPTTAPSNDLPPLSFASDVTDGRNWHGLGLDVAAEVDYPTSSSSNQSRPDARNDLYVDHAKSISQSQPAVNPGSTPTLMKPDCREPVDKLIITVTADAENHVIVDITGTKDAAFIRERMFSRLRIPDDDYDNYQICRTELGEAAPGDPITDHQLMIYCQAWADAKGTRKFLVQRNFATPPLQPHFAPPPQANATSHVQNPPAIPNPTPPLSSSTYDRRRTDNAGGEAQERYWEAQSTEYYYSQYNKTRAGKDRQSRRQKQVHGSDGSAPSRHKAHWSESVDSSVPHHGWVMVNEVSPTPSSATAPEWFQGMGRRTQSYGYSNTTGAVNEWAGSPPSDGPWASATTPSASRPYPHATNTSYKATNPTLQRSRAVKNPKPRPHPRTERRGHIHLPPGAVDPRMRQIEWQQKEPTASPAQFYSPSIAPDYPPRAAYNDPQQSTPPSSGSAGTPGASQDYGNGLPRSLDNGASLFSSDIFVDGPLNRNPVLRPKPSTDRMNILDRTMAAHAQRQSRDRTPSLQGPPLPTPSASSSYRVGWMSNSTSPAPSRPKSGDVDSGDLNRPSRMEQNATNVPSMLETRRPVITAKATPISLRNAHAKSIRRGPSQSNAGEDAQLNGAEEEEEEYYDSDPSEEDEHFWNNGSVQLTTATPPAIKTSGPDNEGNSILGPFNRTKGPSLWVTIPPLADNRGSPMPTPSAAATNLPTSRENLPSLSPGLTPTSGINRRAPFRWDTWAFRPIQENVLDHLQDFFPDHDLDKQFIDQVRITNESLPSPGGEALPPPVPAPVSKEVKFKHRDRIRFVAEERKKVMERVSSAREPSAKAEKLGRKGSTKLWGSRAEEVTPGQVKCHGVPPTIPESPMGPAPRPTTKWVKGELIGEGTYSKVFLAFNVTTREMMAVKQVKMPQTINDQDDARQVSVVKALESEQRTLEKLDHQNIVQYLGFEKTKEFFSVFLEYVPGGTIGSCLRRHGRFEENIIKSFTSQIVDGLAYLHANKIIHRDIKADSVLVDPSGNCKISSFGILRQSEEIYNNAVMTPVQGSLFWMAPEMIHDDKKGYNAKIDIWSLGCVFIEMFAGRRPWEQDGFVSVVFEAGHNRMAPPIPSDVHLSDEADGFRLKCFAQDPDERPTAEGLKGHPWLDLPPGWIFSDFH